MKKSGGKVYTALNGFEALDVFKEKQDEFDVIFMDIQMPQMDGIETTKRLISLYPDLPPIVALTPNAMKGDREKHLAIGMKDYIAKPVNLKTLQNVLITQLNIS